MRGAIDSAIAALLHNANCYLSVVCTEVHLYTGWIVPTTHTHGDLNYEIA